MSNTRSLVDSDGNINANYLTKELQEALEADVKFKQTDNMKKRAVKTSTDYNEFKNMVAAANLKKLTSKEVESLSHVKKGWQKTVVHDSTASAIILTKEVENDRIRTQNLEVKGVTAPAEVKLKPKSAMEVERDLRRIPEEADKLLYLYRVGLKRAKTLLANGGDTDLLEQIVKLLTFRKADLGCRPSNETEKPQDTPEASIDKVDTVFANVAITASEDLTSVGGVKDNVDPTVPTPQEQLLDPKLRIKWLKAISEFGKFDLMVQFSSQVLLKDVVEVLSVQPSASTVVVAKYQKGIKL
uniref:Dynein attachment factor N-terminal domain-containing protein n=2 Tax=Spumella elongata TaxID=89044 RepID=A0A7S3H1Z1_9STRA